MLALQKEVKQELELNTNVHWTIIHSFVNSLNYDQLIFMKKIISESFMTDKQSYNQGYNFGYTIGYNDGYSEGLNDGRIYERNKD